MNQARTVMDARASIEQGDISAEELVQETLESIRHWEPNINAFLEILEESAVAEAKQADQAHGRGKLHGIPIAIKDIICTTEGHTTAASKMLQRFQSPFAATVIERLKAEGAIIIGKTNCDEFAMGASNEYSAFGPTKNPWDTERVAGGSSGGSGAAVGSGEVMAALGTDTGGSIRMPANFCGVVGVKPTYGRVSRFGAVAYASSFDQIGPMTRTVADAALLLEVLAGHDERDATSSQKAVPTYTEFCTKGVEGLTIGMPKEYFGDEVAKEVRVVVGRAVKELEKLGAKIHNISLPLMQAAVPTYYLLVKSEASTNLARYDGLRYGKLELEAKTLLEHYSEARGRYFGPEVKRSILMGTYALSAGYIDAWYKQASKVRTLIRQEFAAAFQDVDVIIGPVAAELPWKIGQKADDPLAMYQADLLTDPASVAGLPAMSIPCGFSQDLPVGLQIIAPHFKEERLFQVAGAYEQQHDWWQRLPQRS